MLGSSAPPVLEKNTWTAVCRAITRKTLLPKGKFWAGAKFAFWQNIKQLLPLNKN